MTEPTQLGCEDVVISIDVVEEFDESELDVEEFGESELDVEEFDESELDVVDVAEVVSIGDPK